MADTIDVLLALIACKNAGTSSRDNIYIITDDFRIVKREDYEEN